MDINDEDALQAARLKVRGTRERAVRDGRLQDGEAHGGETVGVPEGAGLRGQVGRRRAAVQRMQEERRMGRTSNGRVCSCGLAFQNKSLWKGPGAYSRGG
eukprot:3834648-Pyramimonas_sp.AAC.1